jgi:hypothetical protein
MDKSDERRISVRMPFVSQGFCHVRENKKKYCGTLRDISITGLFMELNDCPNVGQRCDIDIVFQGKHSRLLIEKVGGTIIRSTADGMAVRFDERLEWFVLIPLYFHKVHDQIH